MRLPRQWLEASTQGKSVHAKVDMGEEVYGSGLCPVCQHSMMGPVYCSGKPMQACMEDRVVLPYPDAQHKEYAEQYIPYEPEIEVNPFGA